MSKPRRYRRLPVWAKQAQFIASTAKVVGFVGGRGTGKDLDDNTLIPTPEGFRRMGDLRKGDTVFDDMGNPTSVLGSWHFQDNRCFKLIFSDGTEVVAGEGHLWKVKAVKGHDWHVMETHTIFVTQRRKYVLPVCGRYIVSVEPVETRPTSCISVAAKSKLFLCTEALIVTHNTVVGAIKIQNDARDGEEWMSVSPDSSLIADTTWPVFKEIAQRTGKWIRGVQSPYRKAWFRTRDGGVANITFRSGEKPEKLRGPSKAGLWLDEASIMKPAVVDIARATLRWKGRMGQTLMTFTPRGRLHWTFPSFYTQIPDTDVGKYAKHLIHEFAAAPHLVTPGSQLIQAHSLENPFLPPEYVDVLKALYSEQFARQELAGQFIDIGGLMFSRDGFIHLPGYSIPHDAIRVRYWDRAGTEGAGSYSVGLLMARTFDDRYIIEDVVRGQWGSEERNQVMKNTAEADAKKYDNSVVIYIEQEGGSAGKEVIQQAIRMLAGYPVYRDIVSGSRWKKVSNMKLPGQAKIVRAMGFSAASEGGLVYLDKSAPWARDYLDECLSGDTLVCSSTGPVEIKDVKKGDLVWTRKGLKTVKWSKQTSQSAETITVQLNTGESLTGTKNHPVWVRGKGFVSIGQLRVGDELLSSTEVLGSTAIQTQSRIQSDTTSLDGLGERMLSFTPKFTGTRSGKLRRVTTSTTRTEILGTTTPTTLSQSRRQSITRDTLAIQERLPEQRSNAQFAELNTKQPSPITQKRVVGNARTRLSISTATKQRKSILRRANGVGRNSKRLKLSSQLVQSRVVSGLVINEEKQPVYNLEVEGCHEYFANGVLVHNCTAFPESSVADQVDGSSGAFNKLAGRVTNAGEPSRMDMPRMSKIAEVYHKFAAMRAERGV